ncbi:hypothetical protein [Halalkalibacterium halodurans]|uniref:BH4018 protein n=1 Tax=Halalkalibacterium halodurans (strain ATCC BAA-125 / DSM 18197 / FERM 7344 / JCM 9153 / C-125) TaxID=272558 RepID=Q9K5S0_HALH5|nr:hypothetical protein [Halalkalibacterium halodurans]MDY7224534.1 hypothetical protein [Halalkalibacterium halodurans]MDY7243819.1 hypothetical protein [Halalkalibacterium halodurans]MED4174836.1 hypothetical protein [Halalkalibacterium halodurans]BAB07737.1 BH4018 [Halalkalibacterium halodurans C-125]
MKGSTKKWLIAILLVISGSIFGISMYSEKKNADREIELAWSKVDVTAKDFWLDIMYVNNDPSEVKFFPTEDTNGMMERWKAVTELYPEANYPEEAVEREDWFEVSRIFSEVDFSEVEQKMIEDTDALPEGQRLSYGSLEDYIMYRGLELEPVLIELGLEQKQ